MSDHLKNPSTEKLTRISTYIEIVFLVLVLSTAWIIIPKIQPGVEPGKVLWFWTVSLFWMGFRLIIGHFKMIKFWWAGGLFLFWAAVSGAINGGNGFVGGYYRLQGWWYFFHLGLIYFLAGTTWVEDKVVIKLWSAIGVITLLSGLNSVGEKNSLGIVVVAILLLTLGFKNKIWSIISLVVLFSTQSRSAFLSLLPVFYQKINVWILVIGILIFGWWMRNDGVRLIMWRETFLLWEDRGKWLGIGLDNLHGRLSNVFYDHPHNLVLWLLVSVGNVGAGLFLGWLYLCLSKTGESLWKKIGTSILVFSLFQPLSAAVWVWWMVSLGLLVRGERKDLKPSFSMWRSCFVLILTGVLWWFLVGERVGDYLF